MKNGADKIAEALSTPENRRKLWDNMMQGPRFFEASPIPLSPLITEQMSKEQKARQRGWLIAEEKEDA